MAASALEGLALEGLALEGLAFAGLTVEDLGVAVGVVCARVGLARASASRRVIVRITTRSFIRRELERTEQSFTHHRGLDGFGVLVLDELDGKAAGKMADDPPYHASNSQHRFQGG